MSWNNVLPAWVIFYEWAEREALMSCAFPEEWHSGMSRELPEYLQRISTACMKSYEDGGWNSPYDVPSVRMFDNTKARLEAW